MEEVSRGKHSPKSPRLPRAPAAWGRQKSCPAWGCGTYCWQCQGRRNSLRPGDGNQRPFLTLCLTFLIYRMYVKIILAHWIAVRTKPVNVCRVPGTVPGAHTPYQSAAILAELRTVCQVELWQGSWRVGCPLLYRQPQPPCWAPCLLADPFPSALCPPPFALWDGEGWAPPTSLTPATTCTYIHTHAHSSHGLPHAPGCV